MSSAGCISAHDLDNGEYVGDAPESGASSSAPLSCKGQTGSALDTLPDDFACTGLYSDLASKKLASGVRVFKPAFQLWSDGADKERWIHLPEGKKIDSSKPESWVFPVGTQVFKEFGRGGKRIETRLYQKKKDGSWAHGTYVWNTGETAATRSMGGDIMAADGVYHVPTGRDCDACHEGRADRILGFETVALGADGAEGLTLEKLVDEDLLTDPPARTRMEIGDDGTGLAPPVLGWIHINCGVTCHNARPASDAYSTHLRMTLDSAQLDGRASNDFETISTSVGVKAKTLRWTSETRVIPGDPENSLLYKLITSRAGKNAQMPPLASVIVDTEGVAAVEAWIRNLKPLPANAGDAGTSAGAD